MVEDFATSTPKVLVHCFSTLQVENWELMSLLQHVLSSKHSLFCSQRAVRSRIYGIR